MYSFKTNKQKVPEQTFKMEVHEKRKNNNWKICLCKAGSATNSSLHPFFEKEAIKLLLHVE